MFRENWDETGVVIREGNNLSGVTEPVHTHTALRKTYLLIYFVLHFTDKLTATKGDSSIGA